MRLRLSVLIALLCGASLIASAGVAAYPWPVKPFNKQHPIRANFGDPRTVFLGSIFDDGLSGPGTFLFHNGVDISAPDGTPVYPVVSGTAHVDAENTLVLSPEVQHLACFVGGVYGLTGKLLEREGVRFDAAGTIDLPRWQWRPRVTARSK